jgi:hypothetical protein
VYSACSNFVISIRDANSTDARVYGEKKLETSILSANSQITCMLRPHGSDHVRHSPPPPPLNWMADATVADLGRGRADDLAA